MSGLQLPGRNSELKKQEEAEMMGEMILLKFTLPDGKEETMEIVSSAEVGYVKLLLSQKLELPSSTRYEFASSGKILIDPMSLCDFPHIKPPVAEISVKIL
eukprot:GHVP01021796.1.p1 GENE.GHVP01021796.1~~GHVP01021796.1.p1  ORF type:complete len:101 (+),score=22.19 GHVP01021796.1:24-326(+)